MMRPSLSVWLRVGQGSLYALALLLSGCVSDKKNVRPTAAPAVSGPIQEINLLAIPVALNFDQTPGPDGFVIKVFASNRKRPKPMPIENGVIEVMMFDGAPGSIEDTAEPRRVWTYNAAELRVFEVKASIGISYQLMPAWGDAKPAGNKITVVVRYTTPGGGIVNSAPSVISVAL
jgi:hypothetical protein